MKNTTPKKLLAPLCGRHLLARVRQATKLTRQTAEEFAADAVAEFCDRHPSQAEQIATVKAAG